MLTYCRNLLPLLVLLAVGTQAGGAQEVSPPASLDQALSAEFQCPTGARDSGRGPSPDVVVRWCDVEQNGRSLYHGPLWRWYPNGQLKGKEYYINGDAAGVWPSYYENGHMSSLGGWERGRKRGTWKYWSEEGALTAEVTYSDQSNATVDYYPSGQKKAVGVFTQSGKVGKWTYWAEDGREKANCDFGQGVFAIPRGACQVIADELDPEGYSLPIPVGAKSDDGRLSVRVDTQLFTFTAPQNWIGDVDAGREEDLPLVFYPKGKRWKAPGVNMYIRVCFPNGRSFEQTFKDDRGDFEQNVAEYREQWTKKGRLSGGREYILNSITYKPVIDTDSPFSIVASNKIRERVAYLNASDKVLLLLVLAADSDRELQQSLPAFHALLASFR